MKEVKKVSAPKQIIQGQRKGRTFIMARKHKKLGFRPNLMYISILHIGKICMNAKFLSEISVYDFNIANKQKFRG